MQMLTLLSEEEIGGYEEGEDYGDYTVHGEESVVETGEIVGLDEGMLVEQEQHDGDDAAERKFAKPEGRKQGDEKDQHNDVEGARDPESGADADVAWDGVESGVAVKFEILAGIEDIEAGDPKSNSGGEEQYARVEGAANSDPRGGRGDAECETEHQVG